MKTPAKPVSSIRTAPSGADEHVIAYAVAGAFLAAVALLILLFAVFGGAAWA